MDKKKLCIIRDEIITYISMMKLDSDFSMIDRFEIMMNVNNFLNPEKYYENLDVLNKYAK